MKNINVDLFKRFSAEKKTQMVNNLSYEDLFNVTEETITRIVKEVGDKAWKSNDKNLSLSNECGNNWNSNVSKIELFKKVLYINFYIQYENTDTNHSEKWSYFCKSGEYRGSFLADDMHGNSRTYYFNYFPEDKAKVIKSILLEYITRKYNQKK